MLVKMRDGKVDDVQLKIYEPPRFFEAFLRGRDFTRGPRHHRAHLRHLPGGVPDERRATRWRRHGRVRPRRRPIRALRDLLYCGEWIESHVAARVHAAPAGFPRLRKRDQLAATSRDVVERALRLKKVGNEVMTVIGGREIHPVNVRVGGFYRAPGRASCGRSSRSSSARGRSRSRR